MSFIERLTKKQINEFITNEYPDRKFEAFLEKDRIFIVIFQKFFDSHHNEVGYFESGLANQVYLTDFCSSDMNKNKEWINYLYKIFGEEYKEDFLKDYGNRLFG